MVQSGLFLLPLLALLILLEGTWLSLANSHKRGTSKARRRYRYKVLILRALLVSLALATVLAKVNILNIKPLLIQGLIFTAAMMLPVLIYVLYTDRQASKDRRKGEGNIVSKTSIDDASNAGTFHETNVATPSLNRSAGSPITAGTPERTVQATATLAPDASPVASPVSSEVSSASVSATPRVSSGPPVITRKIQPSPSAPTHNIKREDTTHQELYEDDYSDLDQTLNFDQTLSTNEQLRQIDGNIEYLDIGSGEQDPYSNADGAENPAASESEASDTPSYSAANESLNGAKTGFAITSDADKLPAKRQSQAMQIISSLQKDKLKLQRLVIAQKAVIDSEKQSHDKTLQTAKDALTIMRRAREGQRLAEKVARRERSKRQELQEDNVKMKRQLQNALSLKGERQSS